MGLKIEYIEGQSLLDDDEKEGLLIKTISTRGELDEFEQANIQQAVEWTLKTTFSKKEILTGEFILLVHRKMFSEVWEWAGTKRKTNKNIGVDKHQITVEIKKLLEDCRFWIDKKIWEPDEIAVIFSHRLVTIHPFPNGNGRHSRLMADILISNIFNKPVFTWGRSNLSKSGDIRRKYLAALHRADEGIMQPLIDFARS
jgi:Fic-DOC domain mobile mystery protein B